MIQPGRVFFLFGILGLSFACNPEPDRGLDRAGPAPIPLWVGEVYENRGAQQKNQDGRDHFKWGHWRKAAADFRRAISMDPGLAVAHFNLGLALLQSGRDDVAREHFKKSLQLAPEDQRITGSVYLKESLKEKKGE